MDMKPCSIDKRSQKGAITFGEKDIEGEEGIRKIW